MKILAVDASATACSVALCEDEILLAQNFVHSGLTHSKTLLPMISDVLKSNELSLKEIDLLAVAAGPGSFTGLRIAVSTIKGLSLSSNIPCVPCSTLRSMAWQLAHLEGYTVVPVMDARRKQVYTSRFFIEGGKPIRLTEDGAISIEELSLQLETVTTEKILVGDGANLCFAALENVKIAAPHLRMQLAWGVAQEALARQESAVKGGDLLPEYHRLSQAERERLEKMQQEKG